MQALTNTDEAKVTATTTPAPSFLQAPAVQTPSKITAPAGLSTAQQILKTEGISSSRQLLDSMKVPSAKDIIASEGITSAKDILEKEGLKVQRQKQLQDEMDLRQKELDYMKNYKFDANTFNPTAYETKYGNLDFNNSYVYYDYGNFKDNNDVAFTYRYHINGEDYIFMPESVALTGAKGNNNAQLVNYGFLNKETWKALAENSQAIDLSNLDASALTLNATNHPPTATIRQTKVPETAYEKLQTTGYLFKKEDFDNFYNTYLDGKFRKWGSLDPIYGTAKNQYGGDVQGLSQLPSGELVYITQPSGGYDQVSTYINSEGTAWWHWYNAPKRKTVLQKFVGGVGDVLNAVPFLPEIIVLATGGAAAPFYPAMKGSQTVAAGGDLGDVLTTMGTAYVATTPVMQNATASLSKTFVDSGVMTATTANIAAGAVVNAGYAGTVAALTGQDVGKAITTGALTGGFSAGTPAIAEAIFGDIKAIDSMAGTLNMTRPQLQNLVVSSFGNAAISSAVYDRDFSEMFTQSLVSSGLSISAANTIEKNMKAGGNYDAAAIERAKRGTQLVVQATARSAIRGTDINVELEKAMMKFTEREVLSAAKDFGQKK